MQELSKYLKYLVPLSLIFILFGFFWFYHKNKGENFIAVSSTGNEITTKETSQQDILFVEISGAVNKPGLFKLKAGDRVLDAVNSAGGFSQHSNVNYISQKLNLAEKLSDGKKIYIPFISDETSNAVTSVIDTVCSDGEDTPASTSAGISDASTVRSAEKVDVNSASKEALLALPGIGETYATRIINGRPYDTLADFYTTVKLTSKTKTALESILTIE